VRIVFITPSGRLIPYPFYLLEFYSNNMAREEVVISGLKMIFEMHIEQLSEREIQIIFEGTSLVVLSLGLV